MKEDSDDEDDGDYVPRTRGDDAQAVGKKRREHRQVGARKRRALKRGRERVVSEEPHPRCQWRI